MNNKNKIYQQETFAIPNDVMMEVAQIILQASLSHEIIGIKENKRQIIIGISFQSQLKFHQDAVKNIQDIIKVYHELCFAESEAVNWKEDELF